MSDTSRVQWVQSVPLETDLAQPDLPHTLRVWLAMIDRAQRSIELAQFYVRAPVGSDLDPVMEALSRAGQRGVKIRLLVSNALKGEYESTLQRLQQIPGFVHRIFEMPGAGVGVLHAKYWIIDDEEVFMGSQNFDWRALQHIHETGWLISDVAVNRIFRRLFDWDWELMTPSENPAPYSDASLTSQGEVPWATFGNGEVVISPPNLGPPGFRLALSALVELIARSRQSLEIQLLQYSPLEQVENVRPHRWDVLDQALRSAAARGVRIQLMVSEWNRRQPDYAELQSLARVPGIEIRIPEIPVWSGGAIPYARVIHTKMMIVDGHTTWLGTSNWSEDYFCSSRNVEVILQQSAAAEVGQRIYRTLWNSLLSHEVR